MPNQVTFTKALNSKVGSCMEKGHCTLQCLGCDMPSIAAFNVRLHCLPVTSTFIRNGTSSITANRRMVGFMQTCQTVYDYVRYWTATQLLFILTVVFSSSCVLSCFTVFFFSLLQRFEPSSSVLVPSVNMVFHFSIRILIEFVQKKQNAGCTSETSVNRHSCLPTITSIYNV